MKKKINLAIVDDQRLFRKGLISLLENVESVHVLLESADGEELLKKLQTQKPDVILLDLQMQGMNGLETMLHLKQKYPGIKILVLTMYREHALVQDLIRRGAHGFLLKDNDIGIIIEGIHAVYENGYYFNEHISPEMVQDITDKKLPKTVPGVPLSQREIEIIRLICMEYTNKEISDKLFISARTVGAHRENIFRKINAKNMISVMKYAIRNKLVD